MTKTRIEISHDEAATRLAHASFQDYDEDTADMACAYIEHELPQWSNTPMADDAPLAKLLRVVQDAPEHLEQELRDGNPQAVDYLLAKVTLWQLGVSLAKLTASGRIRIVELTRLTINEFWKSQYVLFVAAFLLDKGCVVLFAEEGGAHKPDLAVDQEFLECKERDIEQIQTMTLDFGSMFRKAKDKFNKKEFQPGVVCFEVDPRVVLAQSDQEWARNQQALFENTQKELSKMPNVKAAILTIRRIGHRGGSVYQAPLLIMVIDNPKSLGNSIAKKYASLFRKISH